MKMKGNVQKFNTWIRNHKHFALACPIVVLLLFYFLTTSYTNFKKKDDRVGGGYNTSLPNQSNELKVKNPNTYYQELIKDSLEQLNRKNKTLNNITEKEKDSLERILEDLDNFSIDENLTKGKAPLKQIPKRTLVLEKENTNSSSRVRLTKESEESLEKKRLEYIRRLKKRREENTIVPKPKKKEKIITLSVFETESKLPEDRIRLVLSKDTTIKGHTFTAGTPVYAFISITKTRIFLKVNTIGKLAINATAVDPSDQTEGLYANDKSKKLYKLYKRKQLKKIKRAGGQILEESTEPTFNETVGDMVDFFKSSNIKEDLKLKFSTGDIISLKINEL